MSIISWFLVLHNWISDWPIRI